MLAFALAATALASEASIPPVPDAWVTDAVGFLSPDARDGLDQELATYERDTGHQVVVWIGGGLDGAPLDDWAIHTFTTWKLGRQGLDDGVAVFVLADDRAIDIEVGYGLEGAVPDAVASRIIREEMAPRLKAGDRDGAVRAGVEGVLQAIGTEPGTAPEPAWTPTPLEGVLVFAGALGLAVFFAYNPRLFWLVVWTGTRGWGGGGRRTGGGFRPGGGRAGGGGARGHW